MTEYVTRVSKEWMCFSTNVTAFPSFKNGFSDYSDIIKEPIWVHFRKETASQWRSYPGCLDWSFYSLPYQLGFLCLEASCGKGCRQAHWCFPSSWSVLLDLSWLVHWLVSNLCRAGIWGESCRGGSKWAIIAPADFAICRHRGGGGGLKGTWPSWVPLCCQILYFWAAGSRAQFNKVNPCTTPSLPPAPVNSFTRT